MANLHKQYKVSAQDATTATLIPVTGSLTGGSTPITQIVVTMGARDTTIFDIVGRVFEVSFERK